VAASGILERYDKFMTQTSLTLYGKVLCMTPMDDDLPMEPAESLRLIERERAEAERNLTPDQRLFLWPWGLAWLIGFTVYFLRYGPDGRVLVDLPSWLPLVTLLGLMMAAGIVTGVAGTRAGRWVSGPSSRQGVLYGITWSLAFSGLATVLSRVSGSLPDPDLTLLWAGAMVALVGALHMAGGAMYEDRNLFALGAFISVVNVVGVVIGPGWHSLMLAVAGGGGMLVAGALAQARVGR
jgi:hypothetical protein